MNLGAAELRARRQKILHQLKTDSELQYPSEFDGDVFSRRCVLFNEVVAISQILSETK